jgi:hypothetical protein
MESAIRQELRRRFISFQEELWRPLHAEPPSVLYHYSPPGGVRGILETRELWVSDVQRLNDKREGTYSLDVFGPILCRKSIPDPIKDVFSKELRRLGEIWFAYVASFCAAKNLDSQWNDYAAGGTGCAVEVDLERPFSFDRIVKALRTKGACRRALGADRGQRRTVLRSDQRSGG